MTMETHSHPERQPEGKDQSGWLGAAIWHTEYPRRYMKTFVSKDGYFGICAVTFILFASSYPELQGEVARMPLGASPWQVALGPGIWFFAMLAYGLAAADAIRRRLAYLAWSTWWILPVFLLSVGCLMLMLVFHIGGFFSWMLGYFLPHLPLLVGSRRGNGPVLSGKTADGHDVS
jgi:hypothetical protein